jgi:molybdenum cofactor biosynthesis enzyme MoaA
MYDSHPKMVHIEVTDKCNSECAVCPRNSFGGTIHENIKNIQLGVDYFKLLGEDFISKIETWHFCGTRGDPMANTEIVEILQYIKSINNKAEIQIRTNGGIGGVERFKQISEIIGYNGFLCFSVDGWEDTNHIYRKNVKWNKVRANMDAYLAGPGICHWDYIVFKHNYHQIQFAKEFATEHNIHLELKEPFGFEDEYKTREVYTLPVYSRQTEKLLYEIEPETEHEIPDFLKGHQPGGMGTKFYGATVKKHTWPEKSNPAWLKEQYPPMSFYSYLKTQKHEYDCEAIDKAEVFIDCDGQFLPCCFIASEQFMGEPQIRNMLSTVDTTLHYPSENWTPQDILQSKFFVKTIPDGFAGKLDDEAGSCHTCVKFCGRKIA